MHKFTLLFVFVLFSLSGCATLEKWHQEWLMENCNVTSAYSNGLSDGLIAGKLPNNYGNSCPYNQLEISAAYLKGFSKGLKGRPKQVYIDKTTHDDRTSTED